MNPAIFRRVAVCLFFILLLPLGATASESAEDAEALFVQALDAYQVDNYDLALGLYTRSAKQGYTKSQFNLALMYYNGNGVEKDDTEAHAWLTVAAESDIEAYVEARDAVSNLLSDEDKNRSGERALEFARVIKANGE